MDPCRGPGVGAGRTVETIPWARARVARTTIRAAIHTGSTWSTARQ